MSRAVGIDLGTTNSVVAVYEGGEPTIIANAEGHRTTPSVVAFSKAGEVLVGEVAKRQAITNPERTVRSVKRHMGTDWSIEIDAKRYTAQEISARILMKLKRDAEAYLGTPVTQAVITVPAYFGDAQRQATKEAGQIAGLEVLRIINEPTAAALAYGLDKQGQDQTILVYDLGGGTFDVSILEIGEGVFEVKSTSGNTHLGGDDWDQRVIDWLVKEFRNDHGVDLSKDRMALQRLKEAAEKAKIELSQVAETEINLPFVTATPEGPLHLLKTLTRSEFQKMTEDLVEATKGPFQQAVKDAGIKVADIDHVILVGGSTRMPAIQDLVRSLTGKEPAQGRQPRRGGRRRRRPPGRGAQGPGEGHPAARRHPADPGHRDPGRGDDPDDRAQHHHPHPALRDLHHRRRRPARGGGPRPPGRAGHGRRQQVAGPLQPDRHPAGPRGVPQIEVTFDIDANGIVSVSAKDLGTGKVQQITITGGTALPKDDIQRMVHDAESHADEDRKRRETAEARNQADHVAYQTEKMLKDYGDKLSEGERSQIQSKVDDLRTALKETDASADRLRQASEAVITASQVLGQRVYEASKAQAAGPAGGAAPGGEEVVEAEIVDDDEGRS